MSYRSEYDDWIFFVVIYSILIVAAFLILSTDANAQTIEQKITRAAIRNGVDPSLALAIAQVESRMDDSLVGDLGEVGLFQLRPEFHPVVKGATDHNIDLAVKYLAALKSRCRSYGDAYFVCYNYGTARKLKYPKLFPYYKKVKLAQQNQRTRIATRD
jgi:soluble lytic murein transglycosylase-like protein